MNDDDHEWEDVSHHGSPFYACKFCDMYQYQCTLPDLMVCKNARRRRAEIAAQKERDERYEYERMLAERRRFEELEKKYGKGAI